EVWRNDLAGLTDLQLVGHVAGIHRRARRAHGCVELLRQRIDRVEAFGRAHRAAAGDDDRRGGQVGALAFAAFNADPARVPGVFGLRLARLDLGRATLAGRGKRGRADGGHHRLILVYLDGDDGVAGIDRALEAALVDDFLNVGDL